jgi:dynein heavy chain
MANPTTMQESEDFAKLWLHECSRVFCDRLVDQTDQSFFRELASEILKQKFKANYSQEIFSVVMRLDYDP